MDDKVLPRSLRVKTSWGVAMGFLERRAQRFRPGDRFGPKPGPAGRRRANADPVGLAAGPGERPELTGLLGRTVLEARTQQICRAYGLIPGPAGPAAGPSRSYLARDAGVEIAADAHGTITAVFLHFHGNDGFAPYRGAIPGGGGTVPRRAALWASLGRPDVSGDAYRERFLGDYGPWDRWLLPAVTLHAQYAPDGDHLHRITLTPPDPGEQRAA
jgi:hypothetical protein